MAASRSDVVAVGHDGMVTMWRRGERELPSWSGRVARRDLRLISMTQNGTVIIAASDSLFILRPQGEVENGGIVTAISIQRNDHRLPAVLATGDSGAALVWSDKVLVIRSLESSSPIATLFSVITRPSVFTGATWTCDGKLILVSATLGDPLMGGEVEILSGPNNEIIPTKPLPFPLDLNVAVVYGDYLEVLGRGGASLLTRIPNGSSACETIPEYQSE